MTATERHHNERVRERTELAHYKKHYERLNDELPIMRKENQRLTAFLQDAAAFIRIQNTWENDVVLATLTHDIMGLANDEPCFEPRVTGYAEAEREQELIK